MSSLSLDKYCVSGFQLSYPILEQRCLPCGAIHCSSARLLSLTFQRGLLPGSSTPTARSQPHRLPGNARDLRACASTAPSHQKPPPAVDQSA